jgi:hypothetical protein
MMGETGGWILFALPLRKGSCPRFPGREAVDTEQVRPRQTGFRGQASFREEAKSSQSPSQHARS